ncbi:MAG: BMP family ABC transporter substrate-binding protein [Eubacteriales bacterium]|nr:BMP family ABC transporter substrate-binding protein [Eubacteriales bacterium]MDD3881030.1 BMP family ABC transporter substrate-binding protein [Eubacteriales bacterium]MDD4511901.1 BMP family ABC transporter substrate-binding protein [Eubacteriales bacterium]
MKKLLAILLAMAMLLGASCAFAETINPDDIEDNMTSTDGKFELAFVTDVGQLKDKSFNQGTWNGVKAYAAANSMSYKYYQPANGDQATDDDRYDAMKAAADGGARVVVAAGFLQASALTKAAVDYPDCKFVFIDGWTLTDADGKALPNVTAIAFQEEQCGYFAGYAVVKNGLTKLGFCGGGGGTNPACCRYGYGFVQGANAAAAELGVQVEMNYSWLYGASYSNSPELQTMANGWYENGTEAIFACGGSMFASITAAAAENDTFVIGVDTDQSFESETVITSAMKGIGEAAQWAITHFYAGTWDEIGGTTVNLGVNDGAVGLPTDTWSLQNFTVDQYNTVLDAVKAGTLVVESDYTVMPTEYSNLKLNIVE